MNSNGFFPAGMSHAKVRLSVDHKTQCYVIQTDSNVHKRWQYFNVIIAYQMIETLDKDLVVCRPYAKVMC